MEEQVNGYYTKQGQLASSTGNIYGIYDLSGASSEFIASYLDNKDTALAKNGIALLNAPAKYKNIYKKGSYDNARNNYETNYERKGDAIYETSNYGESGKYSWFNSESYFIETDQPFFRRGSSYARFRRR